MHPEPVVVHESGPEGAPPVLLVHGLTEAGSAWPDLQRRWAGTWRLHAVDLRGHGHSPRFTTAELTRTADVWLADLVDVASRMPAPPVIVAHSLGAYLALRLAVTRPDLVRAVVLEDPPLPDPGSTTDPEFAAQQEAFLDTFTDGAEAEKARMRVESSWSPEEIDAWAECKPLVDRRMIAHGLHLPGDDWPQVLTRLTVPTLLVVPEAGEQPRIEPPPAHVRVVGIPGVGHCVRRDDADAFHAVVDPFLAALPRA